MPSRWVVLLGLGAVGAAAVAALAAALVFQGDEGAPVRGDLIAYSCHEAGNDWYAVCVMRSDGTEKRHLTSQLTTTDPAWSPDGRRIAFTRNEDVGEYTTYTDDDVFVMNADGEDPRQLTPEQDGRSSEQPSWSPDGGEIVFVHGQSVATSVPSRFGDLFVMGADGSERRRLVPGPANDPAWSPDGREIAFVHGDNLSTTRATMDIYVVRVGGTSRQLTDTPKAFESAPAWSPDSSRIAFARWTNRTPFDGKAAIYVIDRDGRGEKLVLAHEYFAGAPRSLTWSPDGRSIAFETSAGIGCTAIAVVQVDGREPRRLTACNGAQGRALAPAWQPAVGTGSR